MDSELLKTWRGRIQKAEGLQSQYHKGWKDAIDLYNCTYFDNLQGQVDPERVDVHFANWYISNLIPLVYFRDPFIFVKPKHAKYSGFATSMEKIINYSWKELNLKQEFKRTIQSGFMMPPGWIKLGYTAKLGQDVVEIEKETEKSLINEVKDFIKGKIIKEKTLEEQGVLNEYIKEESVFANWIPSWNILIPEGYQVITQMPYLIEIEDISKIDFNADPRYKNKVDIKPSRQLENYRKGSDVITPVTYDRTTPQTDDENAVIRLYHVWDKRNRKRYTLSMMSDDAHFEGDWPYDMEGFPYKPLIFEESLPTNDKSNPYPVNVLAPILPQILEQSKARTQMTKHRKRSGALILAQKGMATEEDMGQLEETEDVQIVTVSNLQAFTMTQTPPLPKDVYNVNEVIKQDLQMGTNMGQLMFQPMAGQRTATQAKLSQSGLELKASARVDVVEDFTVLVAKSLAQLIWQFYSKEKVSEILGEEVSPGMWLDLPDDPKERKKMIQAEFEFSIDAGSTAPPKDETVDRKQTLDAISIIASFAPEKLKKGNTVKQILKKFKFAPELSEIVKTDDEGEMRTAEQENQYMAQGMPQAVSPNEDHEIHVQVHSQTEPNEISDAHIVEHSQYLGLGQAPQQGDTRPPGQSTNPEINRQGITNEGDIDQSVQNLGVGTGPEA